MKKITICLLAALIFAACKSKDNTTPATDIVTTEKQALNDFVDDVAIPQYDALSAQSDALNTAIKTLSTLPTDANLATAKTAWLTMRTSWEQCEGFLFGPVEDNNYDPYMDTWPTDYVQMDSLLAGTHTLTVTDVQGFTLSLRGFHPIEYILFGDHGSRTAAAITARQMQYILSLSADLQNNCHALAQSWDVSGGNYGALIKTAGAGSAKYSTRQQIFTAIADGLIDICDEVGTNKMQGPFASRDPKTVESPYSGNSVADFRNNIIGLQNAYTGHFNTTGKSLSDIVAANNVSLDNNIKAQISTAVASFSQITMPYEDAINNTAQRTQIAQTQTDLATLHTTLEDQLKPYIVQYVRD